ncbi:FHA domain-containing protein [Bacillota bacterium LX-D]|nr:FHA domain-containing protein [Bacillota bacterium LX-D]
MVDFIIAILRYVFLAILFIFVFSIIRLITKDLTANKNYQRKHDTNYCLVVKAAGDLSNLQEGYIYPLQKGEIVLGRDSGCTISIIDPHISGRHAYLYQNANGWFLEDLGSTNGTFLNGKRINSKKRIKNGDIILLGDAVFEVGRWDSESRSAN